MGNATFTQKPRRATEKTKRVNPDVRTAQAQPALRQAPNVAVGARACRSTGAQPTSAGHCHVQRHERLKDAWRNARASRCVDGAREHCAGCRHSAPLARLCAKGAKRTPQAKRPRTTNAKRSRTFISMVDRCAAGQRSRQSCCRRGDLCPSVRCGVQNPIGALRACNHDNNNVRTGALPVSAQG